MTPIRRDSVDIYIQFLILYPVVGFIWSVCHFLVGFERVKVLYFFLLALYQFSSVRPQTLIVDVVNVTLQGGRFQFVKPLLFADQPF